MAILLGLYGKKRSGKDTVGAMLAERWLAQAALSCKSMPVMTIAFANPMKRILSLITGVPAMAMHTDSDKAAPCPAPAAWSTIPVPWIIGTAASYDCLDDDADLTGSILDEDALHARITTALQRFADLHDATPGITIGRALQFLGTECFRECVHEDFWLWCADYALRQIAAYAGVLCVIFTDCRFPNEARWIVQRGGSVIKIVREVIANPAADGRSETHASEVAMDDGPSTLIHTTIRNTSSLEALRGFVHALADTLFCVIP